MYQNDHRIVITLDAGGTNFVFGAMKGCEFITEPVTYPSLAEDLDLCLQTMVKGFEEIISKLDEKPVAISFAFPGPADYPNGIIGGYLPNFPSFREGVALGPFLLKKFGIPVFINNDGDLFAYGEALCGVLPEINRLFEETGNSKRYRNLIGYTFGTGFGVGIVIDGKLNQGDNSCVETFCLPNKLLKDLILEDGVAVRAIKRVYGEESGHKNHLFEPKEICEIADGRREGSRDAAMKAFESLGRTAGDAMAIAAQLIDGIIVIGGGITAARHHFLPALLEEMRSSFSTVSGEKVKRVQMEVLDLENPEDLKKFINGNRREIKVYGSEDTVVYDDMKRIGIVMSKLGASKAISVGAYAFALTKLDSAGK